jgi:hypothetical protein
MVSLSQSRPKTQGGGPSMHGNKKHNKIVNTSPKCTERPLSLMSDRRVVRGNTYSGAVEAGGHAKVGGCEN